MNITPLLTEAEHHLADHALERAATLYAQAQAQCAGLSPLPRLGLARVALLRECPDEAAQVLDGLLKDFPKCAAALSLRGVVEEKRGDLEAAAHLHHRALTLEPTLTLAHLNLGRLAMKQQQWARAAASYQLAVEHGATTPDVGAQFGLALFRSGRVSDAVRVLGHVVEGHPKHLDALFALVEVLVETAQLTFAAQLLDNAVERFPHEPRIASKRARIAVQLNDLEAARREAWRVTSLAPNDPEPWLFAAVVDNLARDFESATRALRHVLKLKPQHAKALFQLGVIAESTRDVTEARRCYRSSISIDPHAWEPLNNLALSLLEEGSPEALREARVLLDRAIRLGSAPDAIVTRYNLALACIKLGDKAGAKAAANELLKSAPAEHPMATQARRVLKLAA